MRKFFPLLFCLLLGIFTVARAMKPAHAFAPKTNEKKLADNINTQAEGNSDNDDATEASNDESNDPNDDPDSGTTADPDTGDDDGPDDDGSDGNAQNEGD